MFNDNRIDNTGNALNVINCACEAEALQTGRKNKDELNAIVSRRVDISPDLMILDLVPDGWELPDFTPGQYATIGLAKSAKSAGSSMINILPVMNDDQNKLIKRAYSIASGSRNKEYLQFYLRLVDGGSLTSKIWSLKTGDRVWLSPKIKGKFTLEEVPADKNIVLIARGTGLAPYISMLRTISVRDAGRKIAVVHSARHSYDLAYRAELETLQKECDNFTYIPLLSKPQEEPRIWKGHSGYVQKLWKERVVHERWGMNITPGNTHVFICGNPDMINDMTEALEEEGFVKHKNRKHPGNIHLEKYW